MRILVTNDDGVHAAGIARLAAIAAEFGEVTVVAPTSEMSAVSHGITLHRPLRSQPVRPGWYAVDGKPADCVYVGVHQLMDPRPDLVLSGINHGPNMGFDVLYSGTVGAAREALVQGLSGVAFSLYGELATLHPHVDDEVRAVLRMVTDGARPLPGRFCLNVNIPNGPDVVVKGRRVTRMGRRVFNPRVEKRVDPRGRDYYWIGSSQFEDAEPGDTDYAVIREGYVSITPLQTDATQQGFMAPLAERLTQEDS